MGIEMLGCRYVPEIMLELRERPDQSKHQLATGLGHARTIIKRLDELEREGWIEYRKGDKYGSKLVRLTLNGEIVAKGLSWIIRSMW